MSIHDIILSREKTKNFKWFDVIIIILVLFGRLVVISTQMYLATLKPAIEMVVIAVAGAAMEVAETTINVTAEGAAHPGNLGYQATIPVIVFVYLSIRNLDFKQIKFRLNWKIISQYLVLSTIMGLSADILYLIFDNGYNYFSVKSLSHINLLSVFPKFAAFSEVAIIYALPNALCEEFYPPDPLGIVQEEYKWSALVFSAIIHTLPHIYQDIASTFIIGVFLGLFYYVSYRKFIESLLPIMLAHSMTDMFGSGLIYLISQW